MVSVRRNGCGVVTWWVKVGDFGRDRFGGECDVREGVVVVGVPRAVADAWGRR